MDQITALRLVRSEGVVPRPAPVADMASEKPPEHASVEAKLRWARVQRGKIAENPAKLARKDGAAKDFSALVLVPPDASERQPMRTRLLPAAVLAAILVGSSAVVWSEMRNGSVLEGAAPVPGVALMHPVLPVLPNFAGEVARLPVGQMQPVAFGMIAGQQIVADFSASLPSVPMVDTVPEVQFGRDAVAISPTEFATFVPGSDLAPVRSAVSGLAASMPESGRFAPHYDYSAVQVRQSAANLLSLMLTGAVAPPEEILQAAEPVAVEASLPLIYVHHGLGVAPQTVQDVIRILAESGYHRVFRIGVPYRIGRSNIRFFHDADRAVAGAVADVVAAEINGPKFSEPRDFSGNADLPQPGTIEVWLADKA